MDLVKPLTASVMKHNVVGTVARSITGVGAGNPAPPPPPAQIGLSRGLIISSLQGLLNAMVFVTPISTEAAAPLVIALNPTITIIGLVLFGLLDDWFEKHGLK